MPLSLLFDFEKSSATICQSNATDTEIRAVTELAGFDSLIINSLGEWTGGTDTDTGCTNRKLGSDQPYCNPNGLHGKDLSKADVSVSVCINALSRSLGGVFVKAYCSIGGDEVTISIEGNAEKKERFKHIVDFARDYIDKRGGFERFAQYGIT